MVLTTATIELLLMNVTVLLQIIALLLLAKRLHFY